MARRAACACTLTVLAVLLAGTLVPSGSALAQAQDPSGGQAYNPGEPAQPTAPPGRARVASDGTAIPPVDAPPAVRAVIEAGNQIARKPYRYGGGHGRWNDRGYDCSGSVSYALHGGRLVRRALDSSGFMRWGDAGRGQWITVYAHGGHAYMVVAGLRFDTSGRGRSGSRWQTARRSTSGYRARHPRGL